MRFFKHGESIAVVLPEKLRKGSEVKEDEDYEFFELEKGSFLLISRKNLEEQQRKSVIAELLKGQGQKTEGQEGATPSGKNPASPENSKAANPDSNSEASLLGRGFAVIVNEEDARSISKQFEKEIKANDIMGVRGFDKKFYIVTAPYYRQNYPRILKAIGSREMGLKDVSIATKLDEPGCNACLQVMKEQGDVIEKRRGVFKVIK
jgi:hypothetical protein